MTTNLLCACGCGQPLRRPGQHWAEPACRSRCHRQRVEQERLDDYDRWSDTEEKYAALIDEETSRFSHTNNNIAHAYAALGLLPTAEIEVVHAAHKALARKWHPDHVTTSRYIRRFYDERLKTINAAYQAIMAHRSG